MDVSINKNQKPTVEQSILSWKLVLDLIDVGYPLGYMETAKGRKQYQNIMNIIVKKAHDIYDKEAHLERNEEPKKGRWIDNTYGQNSDDIECPFCHQNWSVIDNCTETFDYCPGCGAKLD